MRRNRGYTKVMVINPYHEASMTSSVFWSHHTIWQCDTKLSV